MSSILVCPACQGEVSLPEGPLARLECPHCRNELRISADVARSSDEIPPRQYFPATAPSVSAAQLRRVMQPHNRPSAIGQLAGILLGGAMGMVVGYWILNYLGGPRFDFLHVPLPLVPHTQAAREALPPSPQPAPARALMEEEEPPPRQPASMPPASAPADTAPGPPMSSPAPSSAPTFPSYSADQLAEALSAAHAAAGCENCQSTGFIQKTPQDRQSCPVCGGKPARRINADVYAKLCQLAEAITFVELDAGDPQFSHRKQSAEQVFLWAASDRQKQAALGRMTSHLLANRQRKQSGILLAGTVQASGQTGDYFWTRLVLFGLPEEVTVVASAPLRFKPQSRLLLAGSIIDDPRQRLPGYSGIAPQVVFGGLPIPLPDEGR
jgi:hypothetical protein